jgi:hypothetical protein
MNAITFDTHKYIKNLRDSGIPEPQAEAFVHAQQEIFAQALDNTIASKRDIEQLDIKIDKLDTSFRHEVSLLKWMMGVLIAIAVANFAKQFF